VAAPPISNKTAAEAVLFRFPLPSDVKSLKYAKSNHCKAFFQVEPDLATRFQVRRYRPATRKRIVITKLWPKDMAQPWPWQDQGRQAVLQRYR
jgi:hypothetical protein